MNKTFALQTGRPAVVFKGDLLGRDLKRGTFPGLAGQRISDGTVQNGGILIYGQSPSPES